MESGIPIKPGSSYTFTTESSHKGMRLDIFLVEKFPTYSRSFFKHVIDDGLATVQGKKVTKAGQLLKENETVCLTFPVTEKNILKNSSLIDDMGTHIIYQETDFAIIYKPAGLTVHASSERATAMTLVDWLVNTFSTIETVGYKDRPGIVHRLDKDTSGLMIIPLTAPAFATFGALFKNRHIHKTYLAVVKGHPEKTGTVDFPIARHQTVRNKMTHHTSGRAAVTHFTTLAHFEESSIIEARPVTGRTHQIRVHCATIGHPLLGDTVYGSANPFIKRHALHAYKLNFVYNKKEYNFTSPVPEDFQKLLSALSPDDKPYIV